MVFYIMNCCYRACTRPYANTVAYQLGLHHRTEWSCFNLFQPTHPTKCYTSGLNLQEALVLRQRAACSRHSQLRGTPLPALLLVSRPARARQTRRMLPPLHEVAQGAWAQASNLILQECDLRGVMFYL